MWPLSFGKAAVVWHCEPIAITLEKAKQANQAPALNERSFSKHEGASSAVIAYGPDQSLVIVNAGTSACRESIHATRLPADLLVKVTKGFSVLSGITAESRSCNQGPQFQKFPAMGLRKMVFSTDLCVLRKCPAE